MAELRIQPKKPSPSPWLLVALAGLLLAAAAYFFLRPDPLDTPRVASPATTTPVPADTAAASSAAGSAPAMPPSPADSVPASGSPGQPDSVATAYTRTGLAQLSPALMRLADRPDLRDDATIQEQRDNFSSATARLADGDPRASLRPGLLAAANLLLAVQQHAYPNLELEVSDLVRQANQLSGRNATPAEQAQNRAYVAQVAALLNMMSYPAADVL